MGGDDGLGSLTGGGGWVDEIEYGAEFVGWREAVSEDGEVDGAFELLFLSGFCVFVVGRVNTFEREGTAVFWVFEDEGWASAVARKFATDCEEGVADGLCIEALTVHAPIGFVGGIQFVGFGEIGARESIGAAEDEGAQELFLRPVVCHETGGEMVEKFGVRGEFAARAKVINTGNNAGVEQLLPDAVDGNASGEWVAFVGEPMGELESATLPGWDGGERLP